MKKLLLILIIGLVLLNGCSKENRPDFYDKENFKAGYLGGCLDGCMGLKKEYYNVTQSFDCYTLCDLYYNEVDLYEQ